MQTQLIGRTASAMPQAGYRARALLETTAPGRVLAVALGLGLAVDVLFYDQLFGVSAVLFVGLLLGALIWLARSEGLPAARRNLWLLTLPVLFAALIAVRADALLTYLNVLAGLVLLAVAFTYYLGGRIGRLGLAGYGVQLLNAAGQALMLAAPIVPPGLRELAAWWRWPAVGPLLRGVVLALPVLLVFAALFASADLVFARLLGDLLRLDIFWTLPTLALQALFVLGAAWLCAGGLIYALGRRYANDGPGEVEQALARVPGLVAIGHVEAATLLVLVNALFAAFGLVQMGYLFGGPANIAAGGFTYADYARRGFFELVAVAVLTLGLILGLHHLTRRATPGRRLAFNGLSTVLVALVGVLLLAAHGRMLLYEEAYGYTHLRLYVHLFMAALALLFAWFILTLWTRPARFALGAFLVACSYLLALNMINPDALIAEQNLARYVATGRLDAEYLAGLSDDAVPVLVAALNTLRGAEREMIRSELANRLAAMEEQDGWRAWPAANLGRYAAYQSLTAHRSELGSGRSLGTPTPLTTLHDALRVGAEANGELRQWSLPLLRRLPSSLRWGGGSGAAEPAIRRPELDGPRRDKLRRGAVEGDGP